MGFKGYLSWNDAIYGSSNNWIDTNHCVPKNCLMVTNSLVWTVGLFCLI